MTIFICISRFVTVEPNLKLFKNYKKGLFWCKGDNTRFNDSLLNKRGSAALEVAIEYKIISDPKKENLQWNVEVPKMLH